jgi:hypothetical protein
MTSGNRHAGEHPAEAGMLQPEEYEKIKEILPRGEILSTIAEFKRCFLDTISPEW